MNIINKYFIMQILIIRHAKAGPRALLGFIGKKDATRPLTDAGRKHPCHTGAMTVTLKPTGIHGGAGIRRD